MPFEHVPPLHDLPHAPQLLGSVFGSTHAEPQSFFGLLHVTVQEPVTQLLLPLHALPHAPQFFGSDPVLTQVVPQRVCEPEHCGPVSTPASFPGAPVSWGPPASGGGL